MNQVDTPQTRCRAGVARGDITPPIGIYHRMWGAAIHDRATGVHRPLLATLLWLEPRAGDTTQAQLLVALDQCVVDSTEMARFFCGQETGAAQSEKPARRVPNRDQRPREQPGDETVQTTGCGPARIDRAPRHVP